MTLYDSFSGIFLVWIPSVGGDSGAANAGFDGLRIRGSEYWFPCTCVCTVALPEHMRFSPKRGCLDVFHSRPHRMKQRGPARPHVEADQETP